MSVKPKYWFTIYHYPQNVIVLNYDFLVSDAVIEQIYTIKNIQPYWHPTQRSLCHDCSERGNGLTIIQLQDG